MATIIRKDNARLTQSGRPVQPVAFSLTDMRGQADDYLNTVRREAAKIVQQAHQQAEQIRRQAEAEGRQAADAVLDQKVEKRMDKVLPALEQLIKQINDLKGELQCNWEQSALKVSTAIAQRIIRRELAHDPQITLELIADALKLATGAADIKVHLNPADYESLGNQVERLAATLCHLAPSDVVADPSVTSGGCIVTTQFGQIDQQIESQLRRIEEDLK